jgi:glycosyltransferase involved in cell wall biosynthesis
MPIVIIDAMAAGRPVVASEVAGIPEQVVDRVTGRLVPPGDAASLANALRDILGEDDVRVEMGVAARARYEANYPPRAFIDAYRRLYASILAGKGACAANSLTNGDEPQSVIARKPATGAHHVH